MTLFRFLFPFEKIKKGSSVVIYGTEVMAQSYLLQIRGSGYCTCIGFLDDRNKEEYAAVPAIKGIGIYKSEEILNLEYDYVVIATEIHNAALADKLLRLGVREQKIVCDIHRIDADSLREKQPAQRRETVPQAKAHGRMNLAQDVDRLEYISVRNVHHSKKQDSFSIMGMEFHAVKNCLCMASAKGQSILPVRDGEMNVIFKESYRYPYPDQMKHDTYLAGLKTEGAIVLDEAVPLCPRSGGNLWHWMHECFGVALLLEQNKYKGAYIVQDEDFIVETMYFLGIEPHRIVSSHGKYIIKKAIIPIVPSGRFGYGNPQLMRMISDAILECTGILPGKKLTYVKRIHSRKIINEGALLDVLRKYDFTVFVPESVPIKEQFRFMTNSVLTLTPHGANITLALAKPKRSVLIECFGFSYVNYASQVVVNARDLLHIPMPEHTTPDIINRAYGIDDTRLNMRVNTKALQSLIEGLLLRKHD